MNKAGIDSRTILNTNDGAMANKGFRFFDPRIAEGITLTGQLIIQNAENAVNAFMQKLLGTEKDYIIALDTDSLYINLQEFVEKFCPNKTDDEIVEFMSKSSPKFTQVINDACDKLCDSMNWNRDVIVFKPESIAKHAVWTGKKQYALLVYDNEGVRYAKPKLKIMGIALVRSSTPNCVKEPLRNCVMQILTGNEKTLQGYVRQQETIYMKLSPEQIAFPRGVNNMAKYSSKTSIYQKGCPIAVRAALLHNHKVSELKLQEKYEIIREGGKIRYIYLKEPNTLRENVIGFTDKFPVEFNLTKFVDYNIMWEKSFIAPLKKLTDAVGWHHEETNTLESLFD